MTDTTFSHGARAWDKLIREFREQMIRDGKWTKRQEDRHQRIFNPQPGDEHETAESVASF